MSNQQAATSAPTEAPASTPDVNTAPETLDQVAQRVDGLKAESQKSTEAPKDVVQKVQEAKRIKSLKLKVYGEEIEEQLPFEIDDNPEVVEYLTKQLQMSKAADRAMKEKGGFEKQIQVFLENLKGDTAGVLQQLGIDPIEFAAKQLELEIEKGKMSPEQRRSMELEEKNKKLEEDFKKKEDEYKQREFEAKRKQIEQRVESQMIQALDKSDLPHTPYVAERILRYMAMGLTDPDGPVSLSPEEVMPLVREDILKDLQLFIGKLPDDKIEDFIGKDIFSKVRKKNIAKLKAQPQTPATAKAAIKEISNNQKSSQKEVKEPQRISARRFFGV